MIFAFALALRSAGAGDTLTPDEGYTWLVASASGADEFFERLATYENTPPLFYALLWPLPLDDEVWLRLPSLVASLVAVLVIYAIVRELSGTAAALLAALGLAVAPYYVGYGNYARAFMVAGLGILLALWAVARLAQGRRARWWWLYAAGAVIALYAEYDAVLFLAPAIAILLAVGGRTRREVVVFGSLPVLALVPWVPEAVSSVRAIGDEKIEPNFPPPGLESSRDLIVSLFVGENGAASTSGLRWLQALLVLGVLAAAASLIWRRPGAVSGLAGPADPSASKLTVLLLGGTAAMALVLHALMAIAGPDVFAPRYLTAVIPLGVALAACGLVRVRWRAAVPLAACAGVVLGIAVFVERFGQELEVDPAPVVALAEEYEPSRVLTNSATLAYYLRDFNPRVDRPFGRGRGVEGTCGPRCMIVEDARIDPGARSGPGRLVQIGPRIVRYSPDP